MAEATNLDSVGINDSSRQEELPMILSFHKRLEIAHKDFEIKLAVFEFM